MPTLHWIGKEKVINHHLDVPYRVLDHQYTFNGEQERGNKIIHGDNLEALKALLPEYEGKIKCIYIDPPYNTGNENWVYNDNVNDPKIKKWLGQVVGKEAEDLTRHDKWLCMMYPRLKLLHKLLAEDGAIFISIDDNEQANLKLVCDEIFGGGNFLNNIIWQKKYTQSNDAKYLSDTHDFILCYAKKKPLLQIGLFPRNDKQLGAYTNPDNDINGPWKATPLTVKSPSDAYIYEIETPSGRKISPPVGRSWMYSKERFLQDIRNGCVWFGNKGDNVPAKKSYLSEVKQGVTPKTIWLYDEAGHNHEANQQIKDILPSHSFDSPKPTRLVELILKVAKANENSIILDSFAGSGTTAHAVLNLNKQDGGNRKFICIEMEDYAETITAERVKRVINGYGDKEGTGGSFDYYELGPALFNGDNEINELVGVEKLRQYMYYTETKCTLSASGGGVRRTEEDNEYLLRKHNDTAYYFYYEQDMVTTLNHDFLSTIKTKAEQYVIYADNCLLTKEFMTKHHIIFKKIPRDITKF
ncbi:MAG: site-specific DNA-methyltransferase [Bacteroidetes bacterium]|nr:site-specific DNA-methyltransferase [Bacteroidota bacterium]